MSKSHNVHIIQTCDGDVYKPMMDITEPLHRQYAKRYGYTYSRYDGIKRGFKPWHAAFNRIYLVLEIMDDMAKKKSSRENKESQKSQNIDWILYMDADAVIVNLDKSVDSFLDNRYALVACRGSIDDPKITWNINNGVMFYNLNHPHTRIILEKWKTLYENVNDTFLQNEPEGVFADPIKHVNDQDMLCFVLYQEEYRKSARIYRGPQHNVFNYSGPFIQQVLRCSTNTIESRIDNVKSLVDEVNKKHKVSVSAVTGKRLL